MQQHMGMMGQMPGCMHAGMSSQGVQTTDGQPQILQGLTPEVLQELLTDDAKLQKFLAENPQMMEEIIKHL
jgi:hypothetical protein